MVFTSADFTWGPITFVALLMVLSVIISKYKNERDKRLFLQAFYVKMIASVLFTLVTAFYYGGGDTEMYYHSAIDLQRAVSDNFDNFWKIYTTKVINVKTDLMYYFIFDGSRYPTFEAMHGISNFLVPKLALPIGLLTDMSYVSMSMGFSFFALGGSIRLYKFFTYYYPDYWREIALATLFLPSAAFWSSGLLKDPLCFGSVGFLLYGVLSLFVKRRKIFWSIVWIVVSSLILFHVKVYILLALAPAIILWLFAEVNKVVENKILRRIMALMTFAAGIGTAFFLINYVSSDESAQQYRLDTFIETSQYNREIYREFSERETGAYFTIQTKNPALVVLYGMVATLFRPFPWEISSIIVLFSALEALFFSFITFKLMYMRGFFNFFRKAIASPIFLMCLVFSLIFAAAVGMSATNFGSISRYKIPCLPFYLTMILILYRQAGLKYPQWFSNILGYRRPRPKIKESLPVFPKANNFGGDNQIAKNEQP